MSGFNRVILIGNLTRDPELRYTPNKVPVCDIRLAVTRKTKDKEETVFVDVTAWNKSAENVAQYLDKGAGILVEGRLTQDEWEDKETGKKRSRLRVTADAIQFLSRTKKEKQEEPAPKREARDLDDFGEGEGAPF